jgi:hypothetical protein
MDTDKEAGRGSGGERGGGHDTRRDERKVEGGCSMSRLVGIGALGVTVGPDELNAMEDRLGGADEHPTLHTHWIIFVTQVDDFYNESSK